jgi:hypothetical protein
MKSLFLLVAIASTAYVSYSYSSTDGKSCLVCPMTGEPVFTSMSAKTEAEAGPCCASGTASLMTGLSADAPSCCSKASGSGCPNGDSEATLTSALGAECEASCEKGCCKDKADAVDVTETPEAIAPEGHEVVAELTEAE